LQRTFSTFPDGRPGLGLLLLRATAGINLGYYGCALVRQDPKVSGMVFAAVAIVSGIALLLGYLTPVAATLAALTSLGAGLEWPPPLSLGPDSFRLSFALLMIIAVALVCLGPGAFSLDARNYGRREIIIPHRPKGSPQE
jgi:uncharacterized membrane protein YphA (DoxX/SURF4 family)